MKISPVIIKLVEKEMTRNGNKPSKADFLKCAALINKEAGEMLSGVFKAIKNNDYSADRKWRISHNVIQTIAVAIQFLEYHFHYFIEDDVFEQLEREYRGHTEGIMVNSPKTTDDEP